MTTDDIDLTGPTERAARAAYCINQRIRPSWGAVPEWDELAPDRRHALIEFLTPVVNAAFNGDETVRYVEVPR